MTNVNGSGPASVQCTFPYRLVLHPFPSTSSPNSTSISTNNSSGDVNHTSTIALGECVSIATSLGSTYTITAALYTTAFSIFLFITIIQIIRLLRNKSITPITFQHVLYLHCLGFNFFATLRSVDPQGWTGLLPYAFCEHTADLQSLFAMFACFTVVSSWIMVMQSIAGNKTRNAKHHTKRIFIVGCTIYGLIMIAANIQGVYFGPYWIGRVIGYCTLMSSLAFISTYGIYQGHAITRTLREAMLIFSAPLKQEPRVIIDKQEEEDDIDVHNMSSSPKMEVITSTTHHRNDSVDIDAAAGGDAPVAAAAVEMATSTVEPMPNSSPSLAPQPSPSLAPIPIPCDVPPLNSSLLSPTRDRASISIPSRALRTFASPRTSSVFLSPRIRENSPDDSTFAAVKSMQRLLMCAFIGATMVCVWGGITINNTIQARDTYFTDPDLFPKTLMDVIPFYLLDVIAISVMSLIMYSYRHIRTTKPEDTRYQVSTHAIAQIVSRRGSARMQRVISPRNQRAIHPQPHYVQQQEESHQLNR